MYSRTLFIAGLFQVISIIAVAQTDKKAAELKNLEVPVANAKARVAMNEKRVAAADSLIDAGKMMITEIKAELKAIDSDSRKLEKNYAAQRKPLNKLANTRDKAAANKARTDLRALETRYKTDNRALETRLRDAYRKQTTAIGNIQKGKTSRKNAMDALKISKNALKAVQAKYDAAAARLSIPGNGQLDS
ncbi:MAG: hypothetical protein NTW82_02375 [Bacteroidia bacterium]|nr:hypothetical protein [Bacteroidia bacterium]